jgi:hypothetical protein
VDRIACPWLIRRFIDPSAMFLFVAPAEVEEVADQYRATPFGIDGVFWSYHDDRCTFDVMLDEFGVHSPPLDRLALIVRAADTACPDLAAEAPGLLAASLGLSCMYTDDLAQLEAGLTLYDAFYRWSRDATDATHNWPAGRSHPDPQGSWRRERQNAPDRRARTVHVAVRIGRPRSTSDHTNNSALNLSAEKPLPCNYHHRSLL